MVMLVSWSGHVSWTEKNSGKLQLAVCRDWSYHLLLQHAALCHLAISDNLMHRLPVDPERCHSVGDRHSAIRPHLASFPPAALPSVVIEHRVWGHHSGQTGTMPVWLMTNALSPMNARPRRLRLAETCTVLVSPTSVTEPSVQLDLGSGTIFQWSSDRWTCHHTIQTSTEGVFIWSVCRKCSINLPLTVL